MAVRIRGFAPGNAPHQGSATFGRQHKSKWPHKPAGGVNT